MSEPKCRELLQRYVVAMRDDLELPSREECERAIAQSEQHEMAVSAMTVLQKAQETQGKNFLDDYMTVMQEREELRQEVKTLREALVEAAIPLEVLLAHETNTTPEWRLPMFAREMTAQIVKSVAAIRTALKIGDVDAKPTA